MLLHLESIACARYFATAPGPVASIPGVVSPAGFAHCLDTSLLPSFQVLTLEDF